MLCLLYLLDLLYLLYLLDLLYLFYSTDLLLPTLVLSRSGPTATKCTSDTRTLPDPLLNPPRPPPELSRDSLCKLLGFCPMLQHRSDHRSRSANPRADSTGKAAIPQNTLQIPKEKLRFLTENYKFLRKRGRRRSSQVVGRRKSSVVASRRLSQS